MTPNPQHAPSEPCWASLASADPQAAVPFYRRLLGWNATWAGGAADMSLDAAPVSQIAAVGDGEPGWLTHIAVGDIEESIARAVDAEAGHPATRERALRICASRTVAR